MKRILPFVFGLGLASFLVAANLYLFFTPLEISPILKSSPVDFMSPNTNEISNFKEDKALLLVHSQTRPLFSPTRRPWVGPASEPAPEPAPPAIEAIAIEPVINVDLQPPDVALIGIQKTPDGAKALLLKAGSADAVWFKSGGRIDEWTIATIENGMVELANGNQKIKLELYPNSTPLAPPTQPVQP
jgi:hypothetical protein